MTGAPFPLGHRPPLTLATARVAAAIDLNWDAIGRLTSHTNDLGSFTLAWLGQTGQIAARQLAGTTPATSWSYLPNAGDRRLAGVSTAGLAVGQSTAFAFTNNADFITGQVETSDAALSYPPQVAAMNASFNTLNQMATLNTQALTWDANGNLLSDGTHTYSWDAENRLVAVAYAGAPTQSTTFAYDGLGRRVTITSTPAGGGAVATSYIWCGSQPCQARNAGNAVTRAYYAEGEFSPGSPGVSAYYAPDQIGSARRVFTSASAPAYDYDPYGAPLQSTAPATDYVWAGMFNQADAGLYLTPARAYSPALGRWLSRDPLGEDSDPDGNLYVYAGGEPVGKSDPAGLDNYIVFREILFPGSGIFHRSSFLCTPQGLQYYGYGPQNPDMFNPGQLIEERNSGSETEKDDYAAFSSVYRRGLGSYWTSQGEVVLINGPDTDANVESRGNYLDTILGNAVSPGRTPYNAFGANSNAANQYVSLPQGSPPPEPGALNAPGASLSSVLAPRH